MTGCDVVIVGGGPAGSTVASILLKYRPTARVVILERAQHPRHHVGETLVAELNRVLHEMGAYPKVANAGFVKKYGATFLWGDESRLWDMIFGEISPLQREAANLHDVQTEHTWHVDRAVYDNLLLRHAAELGAQVREGEDVVALLKEDERVVGVRLSTGEEIRSRFVVDATGQAGLLGSSKDRILDHRLRNVAVWGYWKGFQPSERHYGRVEDSSRAFIVAHPYGWSWCFPIRKDLLSVGVVTSLAAHNERKTRDNEAFYEEAIASSPELSAILQGAERVLYEEGGPSVYRLGDFSYSSSSIVQPGLVRVGDAAGFIDPILSLGCFLGQYFARYLGYTLNTALDGGAVDEATALDAYRREYRETLDVFREVTYFFYRFNARPDAWWQEARSLVADAGFPSTATDRQAFTFFAGGFAARRSVFREPTSVFDEPFFVDAYRALVGPDDVPEVPTVRLGGAERLAMTGPVKLTRSAVPVDGKGRLAPSLRVDVDLGDDRPELAFVRRINVPPSMGPLFELIDGERTVDELGDALADRLEVGAEHRPSVHRYTRTVAADLVQRGLARDVGR